MLWFEISARVPRPEVEAVTALMRQAAPGGLSLEEPVDILGPEQGFKIRRGEPVVVRAYLPSGEPGALLVDRLRRGLAAFPDVEVTARPMYQEEWATSWREFFGVVETGSRVVVVPSWVDYEPSAGQVVVRVDPGQAFGTGHHETTRLCLAALAESVGSGASVLDVGTGSGVLAIAAALLGAGRVAACDIDPAAVAAARENGARNEVELELWLGTIEAANAQHYDLVVANLSAEANVRLAPALATVLAEGGRLLLSGMLATQSATVRAALGETGLTMVATRHEGEWCLLEFVGAPP